MITRADPEPPEDFPLDRETLAFIILKAQAFDALVPSDDPTDASDAADDRFVDVLEDERDNPTGRELRAKIAGLNDDAKAALVALTWIGRGDYEASEWSDAFTAARERSEAPTTRYLMGIPLLGDLLAEGASALGINVADEETAALSDPDVGAQRDV
jgi:hypothetical protein